MLAYLKDKLPFFISFHQDCSLTWDCLPWKMSFLCLCRGWLLCTMVSEMLMETKNSPVMNYEAISYEEQYWYLPSDSSCWRAQQKKTDFPGSYAKIKRPSDLFHLFRWGNDATGDNNIVTVIQSTSTCIIRCAPPRNPAWGGYYEYYRVQKREWMQKFKLYAPGHPDREQHGCCFSVKFVRSSSFHMNPLDIFFKCNCFPLGSTLFFTNSNQRSERYRSIKGQKLLKLLSFWFYKVSRINIKN